MKKTFFWLAILVTMMTINGCHNNRYDETNVDYTNYNSRQLTTLFLLDENGFAYADIPYKCDSMSRWSTTAANGEFSFVEPDNCLFNFDGLDGVYGNHYDEIVRITDDRNSGKESIPYECSSFGVSSTYSDGSFEYDANDVCSFYL